MERGFFSSRVRGVKQKKGTSTVDSTKENTSANEATTSTCNMEHNLEFNIQHANDVTLNKGAVDSHAPLVNAFGSLNPTSLTAKICAIKNFNAIKKTPLAGNADVAISLTSVLEVIERFGRFSWAKEWHIRLLKIMSRTLEKTDYREPKLKVLSAIHVVNTTTTSKPFDALGSMGDVENARGVGHFDTISEKEVNNLEEYVPKPNPVEVVNKDKLVTVELGSMPSTLMDLQDGNSKSDVEEYDNETDQFIASSYKRHGGSTNDPILHKLDEYDLYDSYDYVVSDLPK
ncbi:hypothetical protein Tco_0914525 [Tanacetum coccineum]